MGAGDRFAVGAGAGSVSATHSHCTLARSTRTDWGAIRAANPRRSAASPEIRPLDPKVFGEQLFTAIFHGEVAEVFQQSLATVSQQGEGLRIRLRLDEAPDLAALPWEYLYHAGRNRFFVLTDETPIVRYLALPQAAVALATFLTKYRSIESLLSLC